MQSASLSLSRNRNELLGDKSVEIGNKRSHYVSEDNIKVMEIEIKLRQVGSSHLLIFTCETVSATHF